MNRLSESYEDLDIEDVALVVKHTISDMSKYKDCTSTGEILEKMNEVLEPYGFYLEDAEYVEPYDSYGNHLQWSTQHILYGTTQSNGLITAVVAAEDLLEDIENNYKIDWDEFMRDIITTFTHEYTHRYQLDKYPDLSGEYDNEYDYLTSNHEMAARAFAGVKELMQIGYTPKDLMGKIKSTSLDWMNESNQLSRLYDYLCCEEPNSKIMRKFKKYLYTAISKYDLDENNSNEKTHKMNRQGMIWEFNEETYVDKNLKPKGLSKSQKQGLSDDGFVDLITAKVVDDYIKGNNEVMRMWDFWDWVLDTGYGLVMCDLITSAIDKNDLEVLTFDYNLYKDMKKQIKEDAEKFVKDSGWRFDKKTQDKINKRAGKKIDESQAAYRASLIYPDEEDDFFDTYEDDVAQLRDDWEFVLDTVRSIDPAVIDILRNININYVDTIEDHNGNKRVAEFDPIQLSLNVSDIYFRLKPDIAAGVLLHELGHAVIVARYIRGGNGVDLIKYAEDCKGHNQEWVDLCKQFEDCFKNVKVPITLNLSDPDIYAQTR